jgi:hypothetical protein
LVDLYNAGRAWRQAYEAAEAARKRRTALSGRLQNARQELLQARDPAQRAELLREISALERQVEALRNSLPPLENTEANTGAVLRDAYKAYEPTYARMAAATRAYEDCVKGCGEEGGGMGTATKVVLGTAILGGVSVGVVKATQGGDGTPGGTTGNAHAGDVRRRFGLWNGRCERRLLRRRHGLAVQRTAQPELPAGAGTGSLHDHRGAPRRRDVPAGLRGSAAAAVKVTPSRALLALQP